LLVVYRLDLLSGDHAKKSSQIPACRSCPRCDCERQYLISALYQMVNVADRYVEEKKLVGPLSIHAPFLLLAMLHRPPSLDYSTESSVVCWPRAESTRLALFRHIAKIADDGAIIEQAKPPITPCLEGSVLPV